MKLDAVVRPTLPPAQAVRGLIGQRNDKEIKNHETIVQQNDTAKTRKTIGQRNDTAKRNKTRTKRISTMNQATRLISENDAAK